MNQSQEKTQTCGNCELSKKAFRPFMNGVPDPEEVKCSIDGRTYLATDSCNKDKWKAKENLL